MPGNGREHLGPQPDHVNANRTTDRVRFDRFDWARRAGSYHRLRTGNQGSHHQVGHVQQQLVTTGAADGTEPHQGLWRSSVGDFYVGPRPRANEYPLAGAFFRRGFRRVSGRSRRCAALSGRRVAVRLTRPRLTWRLHRALTFEEDAFRDADARRGNVAQ